jgi:hypothetical protein
VDTPETGVASKGATPFSSRLLSAARRELRAELEDLWVEFQELAIQGLHHYNAHGPGSPRLHVRDG